MGSSPPDRKDSRTRFLYRQEKKMIGKRIRRLLELSSLLGLVGLFGAYGLLHSTSSSADTQHGATRLGPAAGNDSSIGAIATIGGLNARSTSCPSAAPRKPSPSARTSAARVELVAASSFASVDQPFKSLLPAPLPQTSPSLPNPPTPNSPAVGSTGVSTSPTLNTTVSDPNSSSVTVNFYGKAVPSVTSPGPSFAIIELPDT